MSFKEVASLDAEVTIALGKTDKKTGKPYPKQVEGYYLGSRTVENKRGESKLHFFQTAKGNLGVWGTTDLDRKLSQVAPGTMTRASSTGTKSTPNGDMYTYKVEKDVTNTIDVEIQAEGAGIGSGSDEAPGIYDEDGEGEEYGNEDEDEDTYVAAAAASSAADRKRKVEALLKGNKTKN